MGSLALGHGPVPAMNDFATHLRQLRESRGMSQYRVAKLSGISREGVSRLEEPNADPKLSTLFKLAEALGLAPQELIPAVVNPDRPVHTGTIKSAPKKGKPRK
jgi:transcriptional regulator with XRE-family HTH domain